MQKNVGSQHITVLAIDTATNLPKTGDASNITLYYNGDNGGVTVFSTGSGHPSEDDATNSPGTYTIAATQGETNFNSINISGKSSTSGIRVIPILNLQTVPAAFTIAGGASGGFLIAGSNAATTMSGFTTGALSCTTITASGAVAFQSTFAVTTSTSLAALSATTVTFSGAVAFQSTFATTGTTTFNALTITNATTFSGAITGTSGSNDLRINGAVPGASGGIFIAGTNDHCTITNNLIVSGTTTLTGAVAANGGVTFTSSSGDGFVCSSTGGNGNGVTFSKNGSGKDLNATSTPLTLAKTTNITGFNDVSQTQISGGAYAMNSSSFSFASALDFTSTQKTSLNAATPAVTVSDKTGFSLTSAYDPAKTAAQAGDAMTLTSAYNFAKGTTAMTESYAANTTQPTPIQALYAIQQYLMDFVISGTSYTVQKLDNSTTAFVVTLNDATNPTGADRA